ncbi:MAG: (2Fe-2S) ferredoxin domain-containing protein, partial [Clostridia bacterium]|nr:(2Fe-2S) ferredoxin domain-containing protein [Clostridia bacterium]
MKSLAELEAIRQKTLSRINLRKEDENEAIRVVVGMATCGIAAGARPVMLAFMDEASKRSLN